MFVLAQSDVMAAVLVLAAVVLIGIVLLRSSRYVRRRPDGQQPMVRTPRPHGGDLGHHADAPEEFRRWEVQMHELARELSARLDSKMGALEHLIRESDRAADRLEATLDRTDPEKGRPRHDE